MGHCSLILNSYPSVIILGENSKVHANNIKEFSQELSGHWSGGAVRGLLTFSQLHHHNIMVILKFSGTIYVTLNLVVK